MVDLSEVWAMQQRTICSALMDDYVARWRHLNIDRKNVIQMTQMFDNWDKWLIPPQYPPSVGQYSAAIANGHAMLSGESHFFHSGLPLKRSTVKGRRLVGSAWGWWGWWEGKEDGWREGGEKGKISWRRRGSSVISRRKCESVLVHSWRLIQRCTGSGKCFLLSFTTGRERTLSGVV